MNSVKTLRRKTEASIHSLMKKATEKSDDEDNKSSASEEKEDDSVSSDSTDFGEFHAQ